MAERVVKVTLTAQIAGYLAGMEKVRSETKKTSQDATAALEQQKAAFTELGHTALAFGAIAAAGVALAVKKYADFDQAMSSVQAATHESATNMQLLRDAAIEAGASTVFTAQESANAIEELAKAGISTADILGGALAGSLDLASAGSLGVADAAAIAATAMTQFNLKGSEVPHVADLLSAGAGKAQGSVEDLSQALNQGGLVASQAGFSIEETTGTLAAFASAGLLGSDAGTSLKTAIIALQNPSEKAAGIMAQYGIDMYDASGNMLSVAGIAGQLQSKLGGLTDETRNAALAQIFGNDAVRSANVLYAQGSTGIQEWINKTNDSGYAAETARLKLDNLNGDIEKLGGAFDTALIKSGSAANDSLRFLTQTVTGLVDGFGNLPEVFQGGVLVVGALVAGVGLLGGGLLTVIPKIEATRAAMAGLGMSGKNLAGIIGKGGAVLAALGIVTAGLAGMGQVAQLSSDQISKLNAALKTGNINDLSAQFNTGRRDAEGFQAALNQLYTGDFGQSEQANLAFGKFAAGLGIDAFYKDLRETEAQFQQLGQTLSQTAKTDFPTASKQFADLVKAAGGGEEAVRQLLEAMPDYKAALIDLAAEQGKTLSEQDLLNLGMQKGEVYTNLMRDAAAKNAAVLGDVGAAAEDTSGKISDLVDMLAHFNETQFGADDAVSDFHQSWLDVQDAINGTKLNDAGEEVSTFTGTLDESTQEGIDNNKMLRDLASSANDAAGQVLNLTGKQDDANAILDDARGKLEAIGGAFGLSGDALQEFIDKYLASPKDLTYAVQVAGLSDAQFALDQFLAGNIDRSLYINVRASMPDLNGDVSGGGRPGFASGGAILGNGSPTADDKLIRASSGEHMLDANDVRAMGGQSAVYAFRASLRSGSNARPAGNYMSTSTKGPSRSVTVQQTINAPVGVSGQAIGDSAARRANWEAKVLG